jgi:hypothetical protein
MLSQPAVFRVRVSTSYGMGCLSSRCFCGQLATGYVRTSYAVLRGPDR